MTYCPSMIDCCAWSLSSVTALELNDEQIRLLERFSREFRERQIKVHRIGELAAINTFLVGTLKGVGKVYLQTVLDCYSRFAFGRFYNSKLPLTAVHGEYCGRHDQHPFELFLQLESISHRRTRVRLPQSNGFIERLHRSLLDEHFRIAGRTTWYESIKQMQCDLETYLHHYKHERPHEGRMMQGRTPAQMFEVGITDQPAVEEEFAKAA